MSEVKKPADEFLDALRCCDKCLDDAIAALEQKRDQSEFSDLYIGRIQDVKAMIDGAVEALDRVRFERKKDE